MSNFQFLEKEWSQIYKEAKEAEKLTLTSPKASAILSRSALELAVNWLFENDADLDWPYDTKLSSLIHDQAFTDILKPTMFKEINIIRYNGNDAAHGKPLDPNKALISIKNLFRFLSFLSIYYAEIEVDIPSFSMRHIPDGNQEKETLATLQILEKQLSLIHI